MKRKTTLEVWTERCHALLGCGETTQHVHPVHTCVIDGEPHYVHAPRLAEEAPDYFQLLRQFAERNGIRLKVDQRLDGDLTRHCRRRKFLPVVFLALGLNAQFSLADTGEKRGVSLKLIPNSETLEQHAHSGSPLEGPQLAAADPSVSAQLESILRDHLEIDARTPDTMTADLQALAGYYAHYPEATKLLRQLHKQGWQLRYAPHTFQTDVSGSRIHIDSVTVYFDPRSGAKLKFYTKCDEALPHCVASPADALLHELLHAHTILNDTRRFIAQGGLSTHMYPSEHERLTIQKENALYKAMTAIDQYPRPLRNEHSGRHVLVSCVTCLN